LGVQEAFTAIHHFLQGAGELPALLATETSAVLQQRLLAEATTAAYQEYFWIAAVAGVVSILPAIPWEQLPRRVRTICGLSGARGMGGKRPASAATPVASARQ
jgi:hypothetical protein